MHKLIQIKFPFLYEEFDKGTIKSLHVSPFTPINKGDLIMTIETNNVIIDVPSDNSGFILEVLVKEKETITSNQKILTVSDLESSIGTITKIKEDLNILESDFQKLMKLNFLHLKLVKILKLPYNSSTERIIDKVTELVSRQS